jgi:hypothetical protein
MEDEMKFNLYGIARGAAGPAVVGVLLGVAGCGRAGTVAVHGCTSHSWTQGPVVAETSGVLTNSPTQSYDLPPQTAGNVKVGATLRPVAVYSCRTGYRALGVDVPGAGGGTLLYWWQDPVVTPVPSTAPASATP